MSDIAWNVYANFETKEDPYIVLRFLEFCTVPRQFIQYWIYYFVTPTSEKHNFLFELKSETFYVT
jgi:hypothetical protein